MRSERYDYGHSSQTTITNCPSMRTDLPDNVDNTCERIRADITEVTDVKCLGET